MNKSQHSHQFLAKLLPILSYLAAAAFIINCLKEETTPEKIVDAMAAVYDAPRSVLEADVAKIVDQLRSIGAIDE